MRFTLVCLVFAWLFTAVTTHAQSNADYSAGLKAYLNDDFSSAESRWLSAAKAGDARSMFNMGLLHERGQAKNASPSRAEEWFSKAAEAGYGPAQNYLVQFSKKKPSPASIDAVSEVRRVTSDDRYRKETWLSSRQASNWTIQLLAFESEAKVRAFIDEHQLVQRAAYFRELKQGSTLYKLVYGMYDSKIKAEFARQNLDKSLTQHGPWLRTVESIQAVIQAR